MYSMYANVYTIRFASGSTTRAILHVLLLIWLEETQRQRHDRHSKNKGIGHNGIVSVVDMSGRKQLGHADHHHHTTHQTKQDRVGSIRNDVCKNGPSQEGGDKFGCSRQQTPQESLDAASRCVINGKGDTKSFRNVVNSDRNPKNRSNSWILERGHEGGKSYCNAKQYNTAQNETK